MEHKVLIVEYLKFMQKKIKTSNKILIEQIQKLIRVSIKYAIATCRDQMLAQIWQKFESIESLAKKQSQQQNSINNKLTILKKIAGSDKSLAQAANLDSNGGQRKAASFLLQQE